MIFRTVDFVKNDWVSCAFGNVYIHKCRSSDPKSNKLLSDLERKCPLYNPEIMPARIEKQIALRARLSTFNWEAGVQELGYFGHIWAIMHLGRHIIFCYYSVDKIRPSAHQSLDRTISKWGNSDLIANF